MKRLPLLLLLIPIVADGQVRTLTVDEAVRLAQENNRTLHIARSRVSAAEGRWGELNAGRFPALRLQGSYTRLSDIDPFAVQVPFSPTPVVLSPVILNNYAARLSLQQPLFTGFRLANTVSSAERLADAASHDYERDRADLTHSATVAYWNVFRALEFRRAVTENVEQMKAHLRDVEHLMNQGLATRNDLLKTQVQLSSTQLLEIDALNGVQLAMMSLNIIIGLPLETELHPASAPYDSARGPGGAGDTVQLPVLTRKALGSRPELRSMESRILAGESAVTAARGGWYPQINLFADYYYARPNPRLLPALDEFRNTWDIGLNLSFDLWNWMTTAHQTTQAQASLRQAQDGLAQLQDAIALDVTQSYLEVRKAQEKVKVAARGLEQAQESYRITRTKFAAGLATNTDLLDGEVALLQAETSSITARIDCEIARARLSRSIGDTGEIR